MSAARVVAAMVRADFLERVRRTNFLVTLSITLWAAYMFLPPNHAKYATLNLGGHRGIYNSAWVGSLEAMLTVTFLALAGFYITKNAVERDRRTGVGAILAATPLSKFNYTLGKTLSNFAVLAAMVAAVLVASGVMQLVRGEDTRIDPVALATPFVLLTLPVMAWVAAVAVLFETIPGLRGGLGNVVYFFIWIFSLSLTGATMHAGPIDPVGSSIFVRQMQEACKAVYPDYGAAWGQVAMGFNIKANGTVWDMKTFVWHGAHWSAGALLSRAFWVVTAFGFTGLAAVVFDRFDASPAPYRTKAPRRGRKGARAIVDGANGADEAIAIAVAPPRVIHLTPLPAHAARSRFFALVVAEWRIMVKGVSRWWQIVALGVIIASIPTPLVVLRMGLLFAATIWPLFLLSPLGNREERYGTEQLVFSAPRPVLRALFAQWIAGAALVVALESGALLHLAIVGQVNALLGVVVGALFIPAFALALGAWSGGSKAFEILYLMLWYMGPMNHIAFLDYTGASAITLAKGPPASVEATGNFAIATVSLLALAVVARARRIRR